MNLQEILNIVNFFCAKETEGQTMTPVQYNSLLPYAVNEVYGLYILKDWDTEQRFTDASMPFKVYMGQREFTDLTGNTISAIPPLMIDANGYANIPSDYKRYSSLRFKETTNSATCGVQIKDRDVLVLTDQEYDAYLNSSIKKGTYKHPMCNFQKGYIRFYPTNLAYVDFVYLKYPTTPVYGYTIDALTQQVIYDATTSTQLEFRTEECYKLVASLLSAIGVNLSSEVIMSAAQSKEIKNLVV